jgi:signal transduction histidine kinase
VRVADTGIGISEQARAELFKEFYRAPEARKVFAEGTGLGLAICRRVVQMHGGRIRADSHPQGGSVFTVELPRS